MSKGRFCVRKPTENALFAGRLATFFASETLNHSLENWLDLYICICIYLSLFISPPPEFGKSPATLCNKQRALLNRTGCLRNDRKSVLLLFITVLGRLRDLQYIFALI